MNIEAFRDYYISKKGVTESFPFDEKVLVFKVMNKMFALTDIENYVSINLKCDPERAILLREEHPEIKPGYHMSKIHWNTVSVCGDLSQTFLLELIDHSYDLIVEKLPKKDQALLNSM